MAFVCGTEHLCSLKPLSGHFHGYHAAQSFTVALKIIASVLLPTVENCRQLSQCRAFTTTERWAQDHHTRREKCKYLPEITLDSNLPQCSINIQVLPYYTRNDGQIRAYKTLQECRYQDFCPLVLKTLNYILLHVMPKWQIEVRCLRAPRVA